MATIHSEPKWGYITNFEIELTGSRGQGTEVIHDYTCMYEYTDVRWSIYERYDPNLEDGFTGANCIADCSTHMEVARLLNKWKPVLEVTLKLRGYEDRVVFYLSNY